MDQDLLQTIQSRLRYLPAQLQQLILSDNLSQTLKTIAHTHNLSSDKAAAYETEVMIILLGFDTANSLQQNLLQEGSLDPQTAAHLADETTRLIFSDITGSLREFEEENKQVVQARNPNQQPSQTLVDHIKEFEERKKQKQEEEKRMRETNVPLNLPVEPKDAVEQYQKEEGVREKTRPSGPDPYHEPIE